MNHISILYQVTLTVIINFAKIVTPFFYDFRTSGLDNTHNISEGFFRNTRIIIA